MNDPASFTRLVPGFDFLQSLVKNAGAAVPGIGQWVAPTLDPAELEKRIGELRTVQFWLEQNARLIGATIQAMEVQRMTLATLQTMNVQMGDLRESLQLRVPTPESAPAVAAAEPPPAPAAAPAVAAPTETAGAATAPAGVVDPLQWWGALTKQFSDLAATAMKDNPIAMPKAASAAPAGAAAKPGKKPAAKSRAGRAPAGKAAAPRRARG